MDEVRYMISDVSKRVEVKDHVLRYWQDKLELPIERNEMGHRYYRDSDIEMLKMVKQLMDQGFQLRAIKLLLPNLHKVSSLDDQAMNRLRDELNGKVIEMYREEGMNEETKDEIIEDSSKEEQVVMEDDETSLITNEADTELKEQPSDKVGQFKTIMNHIIMEALKENNTTLSEEICTNVTDGVIKEMSFLMRLQEEKEEERFKKFDATLRDYQKSRMMAAVSLDGKSRKKSKFMKKNKVHI